MATDSSVSSVTQQLDGAQTPSKVRRLHHHAYPVADHEATRYFMEDLLGIPLVATWTEDVHGTGGEFDGMEFCHTFYELSDGSALAYFQMAPPYDKYFLIGKTNLMDHIALETDAVTQEEIHQRLLAAGVSHYIQDHGYVKSMYVDSPDGLMVEICADPDDVEEIKAVRRADAHGALKRWLGGNHENNNDWRNRSGDPVVYDGENLYKGPLYKG
jgi:glyoxylase I family protein